MSWQVVADADDCSVMVIICRYFYLRQVNEVNGGDTVFVRCVCVSVRSRPVYQTSLKL